MNRVCVRSGRHRGLIGLMCLLTIVCVAWPAYACDIAVISGKVTPSGRPMIWKNRDHSASWQQELVYYEAVKPDVGGSIRIIDRTVDWSDFVEDPEDVASLTRPIMSGGVNASGFAITNTTVYEWDPLHEYIFNANVYLMEQALEKCKTVADFDALVATFHGNPFNWDKIISGNFAVLDAQGNAAMYELYTGEGLTAMFAKIQTKKYDANDVDDAPHGFVNLTNSNSYIERTSDDQREIRGREILEELYQQDELTLENILVSLAKDVCGDETDTGSDVDTSACISRYQTNFAMVVEGVKKGENPAFATLWLNMGEPGVGVATPHFACAGKVTPYAWAESECNTPSPVNMDTTCALNQAANDMELTLYDNNDSGEWGILPMDVTIDYDGLILLQSWAIPLEQAVIFNTQNVLDQYRAGYLPGGKTLEGALYDLSHYAAAYTHANYLNQSDVFQAWAFNGLSEDENAVLTGLAQCVSRMVRAFRLF